MTLFLIMRLNTEKTWFTQVIKFINFFKKFTISKCIIFCKLVFFFMPNYIMHYDFIEFSNDVSRKSFSSFKTLTIFYTVLYLYLQISKLYDHLCTILSLTNTFLPLKNSHIVTTQISWASSSMLPSGRIPQLWPEKHIDVRLIYNSVHTNTHIVKHSEINLAVTCQCFFFLFSVVLLRHASQKWLHSIEIWIIGA